MIVMGIFQDEQNWLIVCTDDGKIFIAKIAKKKLKNKNKNNKNNLKNGLPNGVCAADLLQE